MKKHLLLLAALLCFASLAWANFGYQIVEGPVVETEAPVCSTPTDGSVFNDGFLGATAVSGGSFGSAETAWTATQGTNGSIDADATLTGSPPTGSCAEGLNVAVTTSGGATFTMHDLGAALSDDDNNDIYMEFRINSYTLPANYDEFQILGFTYANADPDSSNRVYFQRDASGNPTVRIKASGGTGSSNASVSVATWHTLHMHYDPTEANCYFTIDGGSQYSFTRAAFSSPRYIYSGMCADVDADEAVNIEYGRIWVSTSTP